MEYGRNIVVKGVGKACSRPDLIVISLDLDSVSKSYDKAMSLASDKLEEIYTSLESIGIDRKEVKTVSFNVRTKDEYMNYRHPKGCQLLGFVENCFQHY